MWEWSCRHAALLLAGGMCDNQPDHFAIFLNDDNFNCIKTWLYKLNEQVCSSDGYSKKVVNVHRRAWMHIYSFAALFLKEMLMAWVKCVNSWFISMVWGQEVIALLIVSKQLSPTCFIFFISAPCQNHAFDSFGCLQLSFFSFVPLRLPDNTEQ